jgi:FlaA1/EpsC-like NDP-sugar epimerase
MKKLSKEQLYQVKMNFFSEISIKVLALKILLTIFVLPTLFKCIDELTIASHNIFADVMLSTLVIIIPSLFLILLFKKEISVFEKKYKKGLKNQTE